MMPLLRSINCTQSDDQKFLISKHSDYQKKKIKNDVNNL